MKKILLFIVLSGSMPSMNAQSQGHVGINTPTPTATLHVKANGSTNTTQALKLENSTGTNLLTISDDGTVSGTAATNLMSATGTVPKGSGIFTSTTMQPADGYLSPDGNTFQDDSASPNSFNFYSVAQSVPYNMVVDQLTFVFRTPTFIIGAQPLVVQLFVNGQYSGYSTLFSNSVYVFNQNYVSGASTGSVILQRGDLIAYRITGLQFNPGMRYVSMRYTEQ